MVDSTIIILYFNTIILEKYTMAVFGMVINNSKHPMAVLPDGAHIFVRDLIIFEHVRLGTTKAVIAKFFSNGLHSC